MSKLFWLSEEQFEKIKPLLPDDVRGVPRVDADTVPPAVLLAVSKWLSES